MGVTSGAIRAGTGSVYRFSDYFYCFRDLPLILNFFLRSLFLIVCDSDVFEIESARKYRFDGLKFLWLASLRLGLTTCGARGLPEELLAENCIDQRVIPALICNIDFSPNLNSRSRHGPKAMPIFYMGVLLDTSIPGIAARTLLQGDKSSLREAN